MMLHNTRFSLSVALALPKINNERDKRMFKYNSIKLWNRLPRQVQNIEKLCEVQKGANVYVYYFIRVVLCIFLILTHDYICF